MKLFNEGQINVIKHKKGELDDLIIAEFRDDVIKRNTSMLIAEIKDHSKELRSTFTKPFEEEIVEMYKDECNNKIILLINLNIDDLLLTDIYNELICMRLNLADKLNTVITILLNIEENNKLNYDDSYNMKEDIFRYDSSNKTITKITKGDEEMSIRETIFDNEENIQTIIDKVTSCKKSKSLVLYINLNTDDNINGTMYHIEPQLKQPNVKTPLIISNEDEMESILKSVYSKDINLYCILDRAVSIGDNDIDPSKNVANYLEKLKIIQSKGIDVSIIINGGVKLSSKQNKEESKSGLLNPVIYENKINLIANNKNNYLGVDDIVNDTDYNTLLLIQLDEIKKFNTSCISIEDGVFSESMPTSIHDVDDLNKFIDFMKSVANESKITCEIRCDYDNVNIEMTHHIIKFITFVKYLQIDKNITLNIVITKTLKNHDINKLNYIIEKVDIAYNVNDDGDFIVVKDRINIETKNKEKCRLLYDTIDKPILYENKSNIMITQENSNISIFNLIEEYDNVALLLIGLDEDSKFNTEYFELDCGVFSDTVPTSIHGARDLELFLNHMDDNDNCRDVICVICCDSDNVDDKMIKRMEAMIEKCKYTQSCKDITLVIDICKENDMFSTNKIIRLIEKVDYVYNETEDNEFEVIKDRGGMFCTDDVTPLGVYTTLGVISRMRDDMFNKNISISTIMPDCIESIDEIPSMYLDEEGHYSLSKHFAQSRKDKVKNKYCELKESLEYISKAVDKFKEISTDDQIPTIVTLTLNKLIEEMRKKFNDFKLPDSKPVATSSNKINICSNNINVKVENKDTDNMTFERMIDEMIKRHNK